MERSFLGCTSFVVSRKCTKKNIPFVFLCPLSSSFTLCWQLCDKYGTLFMQKKPYLLLHSWQAGSYGVVIITVLFFFFLQHLLIQRFIVNNYPSLRLVLQIKHLFSCISLLLSLAGISDLFFPQKLMKIKL